MWSVAKWCHTFPVAIWSLVSLYYVFAAMISSTKNKTTKVMSFLGSFVGSLVGAYYTLMMFRIQTAYEEYSGYKTSK